MEHAGIVCHEVEGRGKNRCNLSADKMCPFHQALLNTMRTNLETAEKCGRKLPKRVVKCSACGDQITSVIEDGIHKPSTEVIRPFEFTGAKSPGYSLT
jgi:Fe-S oxidoreductase